MTDEEADLKANDTIGLMYRFVLRGKAVVITEIDHKAHMMCWAPADVVCKANWRATKGEVEAKALREARKGQ